jgi:large subunit ribosomal protein L21
MYAVVKTGGKQYKVAPEETFTVERLNGDAGDEVTLDTVLMVFNGSTLMVGTPVIAGARITASIVEQTRGEKVIVFKKKRRQNYRRKKGHRQDLTVLKVNAINTPAA